MDVAARIALIILTVAVLIIIFVYRRLDKERYRAMTCVNEMDEELRRWIGIGKELACLGDENSDTAKQVETLAAAYEKIRKGNLQKISVVNQIFPQVYAVAVHTSDTVSGAEKIRQLNDCYREISDVADQYNQCSEKLAAYLENGLTGLTGNIFRMRVPEPMENLTIPELFDKT